MKHTWISPFTGLEMTAIDVKDEKRRRANDRYERGAAAYRMRFLGDLSILAAVGLTYLAASQT